MAEPLKATFFAFRRRDESGVLTKASLAFFIVSVVLFAAFIALYWQSLGPVLSWYGEVVAAVARDDAAAIESAGAPPNFLGFVGGLLLWMIPFYILVAAYEAACLRWMIRGERGGFMGLSLGADTWRVWGVYWVWFGLNIAFSMIVGFATALVTGAVVVGGGDGAAAARNAEALVSVLQLVIMAYFAVRLAPAAATSIAERRFAFFDAWKVTKGRFWALFGSFFVLYALYFAAIIVLVIAWFMFAFDVSSVDMEALSDPTRADAAMGAIIQQYVQSLTSPRTWVVLGVLQLIGWVVAVLFYVAAYGVNARAAQAALAEGKITPAS